MFSKYTFFVASISCARVATAITNLYFDDDFELKIIQNNPPKEEINFAGYTTGQTGYE